MLHLLSAVLLSLAGSSGPSTCQEAEVTEPAGGMTVTEARPVMSWREIPGASRYRVEIESRVPEGRVLVSLDTEVSGITFRPPEPLTDFRAAVKVRVTVGCLAEAGSKLRERAASFYIDTSPLCPVPARIAVSDNQRDVEWSAVSKAIRYDVTLVSPADGTTVRRGQSQSTHSPLPPTNETLVAVVRPYCATGFGPWSSALIATGKP